MARARWPGTFRSQPAQSAALADVGTGGLARGHLQPYGEKYANPRPSAGAHDPNSTSTFILGIFAVLRVQAQIRVITLLYKALSHLHEHTRRLDVQNAHVI